MHDLDLLVDLLWVFGVAVVVVLGVAKLRLPSIAGFILAGMLIGPHAIGLVRDTLGVETLSEIGVILLLFGVGLEMPLPRLRRLWRPMLLGGTLQVTLTALLGFVVARGLGLRSVSAITLAMLVVPSSTAIVLRGLSARGELAAPHGRLMLGILLFQDFCVVPMMLVLPALAHSESGLPWRALGRSALLLGLVVVTAALLVPRALHVVAKARRRDAFVLTVLVVCLGTAYAASLAGVSLALGAFVGGVVVAGSAYRHQANAELAPMREALASLFFVSIGMLLDARLFVSAPLAVFGALIGLLSCKALVVLLVAALLRTPLRVAVITAVGLAQLGEFALVLARSAGDAGLLTVPQLRIFLAAGTLSMVATPLLLGLGPRIASAVQRVPAVATLFGMDGAGAAQAAGHAGHVIVAGYGLAGENLVGALTATGMEVVVVDLNAETIRAVTRRGLTAYFGDIASRELLEHVGLGNARELVLLINDPAAAEQAVNMAHALAPTIPITVRARYRSEAERLQALGASEVIVGEVETGHAVVHRVLARVTSGAAATSA